MKLVVPTGTSVSGIYTHGYRRGAWRMVAAGVKIMAIIVPLLVSVAYMTLAERKVLGYVQRRRGPNVVGAYGLVQPIADGIKLFIKELVVPCHANAVIYVLAPVVALALAIAAWAAIPYGKGQLLSDIDVGVMYILAVSGISVYAVLMSGWSSNSKYALLGAIRATAQMISYEVSIGLIVMAVVLCVGSLNLSEIGRAQCNIWYVLPLLPAAALYVVSALAETNRAPFDLTEGESELVSGFNVDYASMGFALFFLAEYANIILMAVFGVVLFLGPGCLGPKASVIVFWFI